jgi:AraC-like DNA-binding protein
MRVEGGLWRLFGQFCDESHAEFQGDHTMDTRAATWPTVDADRHDIAPEARWLSIRQIASDLGVSSSSLKERSLSRGCRRLRWQFLVPG